MSAPMMTYTIAAALKVRIEKDIRSLGDTVHNANPSRWIINIEGGPDGNGVVVIDREASEQNQHAPRVCFFSTVKEYNLWKGLDGIEALLEDSLPR